MNLLDGRRYAGIWQKLRYILGDNTRKSVLLADYIFTEGFLDYQWDFTPKNILVKTQHLSESFLIKKAHSFDWSLVCAYQKLSCKFISKHQEFINWQMVSRYQTLTMDFIEQFKYKLDMDYVQVHQPLTYDFIVKNINQLHLTLILEMNENLSLSPEERIDLEVYNDMLGDEKRQISLSLKRKFHFKDYIYNVKHAQGVI